MLIFFFLIISFAILALWIYIVKSSKDDDFVCPSFAVGIIILLTILLTSRIDYEFKKDEIINILNGYVKYDTISMDKHGKLLEIEIIK